MNGRVSRAVTADLVGPSGKSCAGLQARPRYTAIAAAVASCFAATTAFANPSGMTVVSGSASASVSGNTLSITNSPGAILNWQAFSIGQNEVTRFLQQSAASSVLNRVTGGNPSQILGTLQSNGKVYLINPSGILFGAGAQIDVAGLVASTLNLSNEDFLAGRMRFAETVGAGSVINNGAIRTTQGGSVYLIAPDVQNTGLITSPKGEVVLAAGKSVELVEPGTPGLRVEINAPSNEALNMGQIVADSGRIGIYAGLVRNSGTIRADSVSTDAAGRIILKATRDTTLDAGSVLSANGPAGGSVTVQSGGTTLVSGTIEATGSAQKGGTVQVLGNLVGLGDTASLDASGASGGGTVLVGGDFQGSNASVQNAFRTFVADGAIIKADAVQSGDGGKVIVWADDITRFYGSISARGGATGGNGGFVEISGKRLLDFNGRVDVGAPNGAVGTILFDPDTITVVQGLSGSGPNDGEVSDGQINFADGGEGANFVISEGALEELTGNVILQANQDIVIVPGLDGGLTFTTSGQSFSAEAGRNITVGSAITTTDGEIRLTAGTGPVPDASATLTVNADLTSGNGLIRLESAGSGGIVVGGGATIYSLSDVSLQANKLSLSAANQIRGHSISIWPWNNDTITLGGTGSGLSVTQADFDKLKTEGGELYIGDWLRTYGIHVAGAVTLDSENVASLHLLSGAGGNVTQGGSAPITVDQLAVEAWYGSVDMPAANRVNTLAGYARGSFSFTNAQELTVDYVGGVDGVYVESSGSSGNATINITTTSGALRIHQPVVAYADGGEGGNASVTLTGAGGVEINAYSGGEVRAFASSNDYGAGGAATVAINGGSGGVSILGDGSEGSGTVRAGGGYGYDGDGGAASITMTSTGAGSILLDSALVVAQGGGSNHDTGGSATVSMSSGSGGVMITGYGSTGLSVLARGGDSDANGGGSALVAIAATGTGSVVMDNVARIEVYGGAAGFDNGGAGGNATVTMTTGSGAITINQSYVYATGGDGGEGYSGSNGGNGGNGGNALIALTTGSGPITISDFADMGATGGQGGYGGYGFVSDGGHGGNGGNASVMLTAGAGGITISSASLNASGGSGSYGGDGSEGYGGDGGSGGSALVALSTSGGIMFGSGIASVGGSAGSGGYGDFDYGLDGRGGAGVITLNAGAAGVMLNAGTLQATGGFDEYNRGDGRLEITTSGVLFLNADINVSGRPNVGSSSGIFLNAKRIDGGEGVLFTNTGQLIKLTAADGIGSEFNPVKIYSDASDIEAHNSSSGDVALALVTGDVNIDNFPVTNNANGAGIFVIAEDGNIIVTAPVANPQGAITLRSKLGGGTITIDGGEGNNGSVTSGGGRDVYLYADNMDIFGAVQSSSGFVTASVNTSGREIWLGSSGGGGSALELSDAELNNMTAIGGSGGGLLIGQTGDTPIIIKGPISPSAYPNLYGTTLTQDPGATVTGGISMTASGNVTLTDAGNMIDLFGVTTPGNASVTTASDLLLGDINVDGNLTVNTAGSLNTWSLAGPINVDGLTNLAAVNGIGTTSDPLRTTSSGAGFTATNTGTGDISILSSAAAFTVGGGGASFDNSGGGGYQIASTGNMNVSGTLGTDADALFSAVGIMNVTGYNSGFNTGFSGAAVNFSGLNSGVAGALTVVAGDVNVTNVDVNGGTVSVLASNLNVVSTGGSANLSSNSGSFTGIIGNNINVTGGLTGGNARIYGSPEVNLTVGGAINLTANAGSATIEAGLPTTIHILFPLRASGGYFVNGVENVVWDPATSTGFYAGGAPAILGSSLLITYGAGGLGAEVLAAINFINGERQSAVELGILPEIPNLFDDTKEPGICR